MALNISQLFIKQTAQLKSRALTSIGELTSKFDNGCPTKEELENIIIVKNQIILSINQLQTTINQIDLISTPIETSIPLIENSIKIIKFLPIPTSPTPISVGFITTFSDILNLFKQNLSQFKGQINTFISIKDYINNTSNLLLNQLQILDVLILKCSVEQNLNVNDLLNKSDSTLIQNIQQNNIESYKGFNFEIKYDENNNLKGTLILLFSSYLISKLNPL